jgi:catechol 2,3-dioxygenase-like lactoylglutathione lyase family enzyme
MSVRSMDLRNGSAALFVRNIEVSRKFYSGLLGLTIELDFGKNVIFKSGLTIWEIQNGHIIPATLGIERIADASVNRFEIYFETEDLPEVYRILKNENVRFLHEIHEEPWGQRTIRFFDPDGHLIEIGESMKQFVGRFYKQGLSVEQVSHRTSVPVEQVIRLISEV